MKHKIIVGLLACEALTLSPAVAWAQSVGARSALEEVVVTSRKREESVQDIPLSVTAVSTQMLQELNITSIESVAHLSPNLVINESAGGFPGAVACMRGLCRTNIIISEDPMVGTYVDGIYLGKAVGSMMDMIDLQRVEVLRGPQGTLYGKNTLGGAVNLVSAEPTGHFDLSLNGQLGNYNARNLRGSVNFAITENLAGKVTLMTKRRDPIVTNPSGDDYQNENKQAGRIALRWTPSADVSVNYSYDRTRMRELPAPTTMTFARMPVYTVPGDISTCISGCTLVGATILGLDFAQQVAGKFVDRYNSDGQDHHKDVDIFGHALAVTWELGDFGAVRDLAVKSLTGYREIDTSTGTSYGIQVFFAGNEFFTRTLSQEFQFTGSALDSRLNFTAGLFYIEESGHENNSQNIPIFFVNSGRHSTIDNTSYAAFGEATYDLADSLALTVGLRYTREEKAADNLAFSLPGGAAFLDTKQQTYLGSNLLPNGAPVYYEREITNSDVSPRISLAYSFDTGGMVYATYSKGFKSGGFNAAAGSPVSWGPYDDVVLDSYEVGSKIDFWDQRARVNLAVFYEDIKDMQVQVNSLSPAGTFESIINNAGAARIWGVELETQLLPLPELQFDLNLGYQNAKYKSYMQPNLGGVGETDISDLRVLEFTPKFTYNLRARYEFARSELGAWSASVDVSGMNKHSFQPEPVDAIEEDGYTRVDARIGLDEIPIGRDASLSVSLWAKNLTDKSYRIGGFTFTEDFGFNNYGMPRTYGIEFNYRLN